MSFNDKQTFFYVTETLSVIFGIWIPDGKISKFKKGSLIVWNVLLLSFALIYYACYILIVKEAWKELQLFLRYIAMVLSLTEALVKQMVLRLNQQRIQNVKKTILDEQFHYRSCGLFQPGKMFIESKTYCRTVVMLSFGLLHVNVASILITMWVKLNNESEHVYFPENVTCHDYLPYYFMIPFSTPTIRRCRYALIYMIAGFVIMISYLASYDTTFTTILICTRMKIQILCGAIKSIRERALSKVNLHEVSDLEQVDTQLEEILYEEIKHCAKHLDSLLGACAEIENIFKYVTLMQMLKSVLVQASCLFVVSSLISQSDPHLSTIIQYTMSELSQLLIICYCGNEITEAGYNLNSSIYQSDWLNCSKRYKQCMIIMMSRMQKKIHMTIGKFSPLTLNTFLVVVKGAFSYCAVFRQVNNQ